MLLHLSNNSYSYDIVGEKVENLEIVSNGVKRLIEIGRFRKGLFIYLALLKYVLFFFLIVQGKSRKNASCSGWSGERCQTSTD